MQDLMGHVRAAVEKYNLIEEGDRIAVGVSGGKDSMYLLYALAMMRRYYPKKYEVVALTADPCFNNSQTDYSAIETLCKEWGVEYRIRRTDLGRIIFEDRKEENPCSLCSRMRKGALYEAAKKYGCNKVALGHHLDDAAVTFYMNLFNNGTLGCFEPKVTFDDIGVTVIRPMCLCEERDVIHVAKSEKLPLVESRCQVDGKTERAKVEDIVKELGLSYKGIKEKTVSALIRAHVAGW